MGVYLRTVIAVAVVTLLDTFVPHAGWSVPKDTLEIFFSVFGMVYAIIVGFVLYEALSNYGEIGRFMNAEVNELQDLRDYLMYVEGHPEIRANIEENLVHYAESVVNVEWRAMRDRKNVCTDTPPALYKLMKSIRDIQPQGERRTRVIERLIDSVAVVTTQRTNRISASLEELPRSLLHLFTTLSVLMIVTFTMIPVEVPALRVLLTVATTLGIAFTYFVILDLDYPFHGEWALKPEPFERFIERMRQGGATGS